MLWWDIMCAIPAQRNYQLVLVVTLSRIDRDCQKGVGSEMNPHFRWRKGLVALALAIAASVGITACTGEGVPTPNQNQLGVEHNLPGCSATMKYVANHALITVTSAAVTAEATLGNSPTVVYVGTFTGDGTGATQYRLTARYGSVAAELLGPAGAQAGEIEKNTGFGWVPFTPHTATWTPGCDGEVSYY